MTYPRVVHPKPLAYPSEPELTEVKPGSLARGINWREHEDRPAQTTLMGLDRLMRLGTR